jgi:serine/threonine protein phosphatase PrpC
MLMTALKSAALSHPGRVRRNNEDASYTDPGHGIFLVVDGIGGHNAGETAAAIAVERIRARLERQTGAPELRIREAIALANNEIFAAARTKPEWDGMACVLTLVLIENGAAHIGHVGDSRLYLVRRGEIRKLTRDHSPVGEREDSGEIGEEEAMRHPRRNEVFRDVGSEERTPDAPNFIDYESLPFEPDSALLLCSDGLSDLVPAAQIRSIVESRAGDPEAGARGLIEAANAAGGKDNVTVVLVEGENFTPPPPTVAAQPSRAPRWFLVFAALIELAAAVALVYIYLHPKPPVIIEPHTLTVGGASSPYPTISAALAAAHSGDTVEVLPGEYREHVFLKSGVILRSNVPREARLIASPLNNTAVTVTGAIGARLSGFLIAADPQNPLEYGILLQNTAAEIENVEIEGATIGIRITGPRSPQLTGNAIHDCSQAGVYVEGLVNPWLFHNSFQRDKTAIAIEGGARPILTGNVFEKAPLELPFDMAPVPVRDHNFLLDFRSPARGTSTGPAPVKKGKQQ